MKIQKSKGKIDMDLQKILLTGCGMLVDTIVLFSYFNCYRLKANRTLCAIGVYILYFCVNFIFGILEQPLWSRMLCNIGMIMVVGYLLYENMNSYTIGKEALIFILILGVAELLTIPFIFLATENYDAKIFNDISRPYIWVTSMGLSRIIAIGLFKLYRKKRMQNYEKLDKQEIVILYLPLVISFTYFLAITKWVMNFNDLRKERLISLLVISACVLLSSTLIHMISFEKYINYRDNVQSYFILTQKNDLQYEYYRNQAETYEKMRMMYHDLKNHMLVSQVSMVHEERMSKVLDHFEMFSDTGNDILNILLWAKYNKADKLGIKIDSQIGKVDFDFIDDLDLCSIWGNILDNAIEACSEIDKKKIPEVIVCVMQINDLVLIKIENDCIGSNRKVVDGAFKTTKAEKNMHGIGMESVSYAVEKYDGTCEFECFCDKFITKILIPIPINQ